MEATEVLTEARTLIEKPENWCKNYPAKTHYGQPTHTGSDDAVCFCADGALQRAAYGDIKMLQKVRKLLVIASGGRGHVHLNDLGSTTHDDVLNMFDSAIEASKQAIGL